LKLAEEYIDVVTEKLNVVHDVQVELNANDDDIDDFLQATNGRYHELHVQPLFDSISKERIRADKIQHKLRVFKSSLESIVYGTMCFDVDGATSKIKSNKELKAFSELTKNAIEIACGELGIDADLVLMKIIKQQFINNNNAVAASSSSSSGGGGDKGNSESGQNFDVTHQRGKDGSTTVFADSTHVSEDGQSTSISASVTTPSTSGNDNNTSNNSKNPWAGFSTFAMSKGRTTATAVATTGGGVRASSSAISVTKPAKRRRRRLESLIVDPTTIQQEQDIIDKENPHSISNSNLRARRRLNRRKENNNSQVTLRIGTLIGIFCRCEDDSPMSDVWSRRRLQLQEEEEDSTRRIQEHYQEVDVETNTMVHQDILFSSDNNGQGRQLMGSEIQQRYIEALHDAFQQGPLMGVVAVTQIECDGFLTEAEALAYILNLD